LPGQAGSAIYFAILILYCDEIFEQAANQVGRARNEGAEVVTFEGGLPAPKVRMFTTFATFGGGKSQVGVADEGKGGVRQVLRFAEEEPKGGFLAEGQGGIPIQVAGLDVDGLADGEELDAGAFGVEGAGGGAASQVEGFFGGGGGGRAQENWRLLPGGRSRDR
jgi:hypothetical protein